MVSRMIDLVVARALRVRVRHGHASNWLGGLADQRIARALRAIHEQSLRGLTIDSLASVAGMSRSNFCERFNALVGKSPVRYRNEWRLGVARDMLTKGDARMGEVGSQLVTSRRPLSVVPTRSTSATHLEKRSRLSRPLNDGPAPCLALRC
jgi:AraC-like DNA-binding protein